MTSGGCQTRGEHRQENPKHQHYQDHPNQHEPGLRVAKIHRPSPTEALRNKQSRIVGIVVKDLRVPVPVIITKNDIATPAISERICLCREALGMPEKGQDDRNQQYTHQQEKEPQTHKASSFKAKR
jgi:hypothetical protein